MARGIEAVDRAELLGRVGVWSVFCAPGDAQPIDSIGFGTECGRRPVASGYVEVGTASRLVDEVSWSLRVAARRDALEALGVVEDDRVWRVLALAVVDDAGGEVHLAQYMPAAVVWSVNERPVYPVTRQANGTLMVENLDPAPVGVGGEWCELVVVARLPSAGEGYAYRRMFGGPGWRARVPERLVA